MDKELIQDLNNLRHMLGADSRYGPDKWGFRNHFCTSEGTTDYPSMQRLENRGFVRRRGVFGDTVFHATEAGCRAIGFTDVQIKRAME